MNNDGVMICSGKMLFTVNQWRELEMQTLIYKYLMASIPVPPQLLLHLSTQSNSGSVGFKFSNGLDPEPWRCRRTDGKKWRCSKNAAYDQKYCERHARKTGPRSRKPVETQTYDVKDRPSMLSASNQQTEMLSGDRDVCEDVYNTLQPWLNQGSWACLGSGSGSGLTPGGPLGEALCLGIASTRMEPSSTTSSSCDDGGLNLVNRHDG